jgi:haloalkane dehalogenase
MESTKNILADKTISMSVHAKSKTIDGIRISYQDHGEKDWTPVFLFHGIPTYSYTFRKIIPLLNEKKIRAICPDLPGFGFSDSLKRKEYTLETMATLLSHFIQAFNFNKYFIYANDWGSIIALLLLSGSPQSLQGVVISNGYLPIPGQKTPVHFKFWKYFTKYSPILPISNIINQGSFVNLSKEEKINYELPFVNGKSKHPIRKLPNIIPIHSHHPEIMIIKKAWLKLQQCNIPLLTLFSTHDPYTKEGYKVLQKNIPGTKGQNHKTIKAKHFITEDAPITLAENISKFIKNMEVT